MIGVLTMAGYRIEGDIVRLESNQQAFRLSNRGGKSFLIPLEGRSNDAMMESEEINVGKIDEAFR